MRGGHHPALVDQRRPAVGALLLAMLVHMGDGDVERAPPRSGLRRGAHDDPGTPVAARVERRHERRQAYDLSIKWQAPHGPRLRHPAPGGWIEAQVQLLLEDEIRRLG